jgi:hypothetical protein
MKPNQFIAIVCLLLALVLIAVDRGWVDGDYLPVPTPEPPPTTLHAIIVEESGDRQDSPDLAIVLASMEVRGLFEQFRLIDPNTSVHPDLQPYVDHAKEVGLPRLFLIDPAKKLWWEGAVPLRVEEWRQLVAEVKQ